MTPSSTYRPSLLSIVLAACQLAVPSLASADIIPQRIVSRYKADEGNKCSSLVTAGSIGLGLLLVVLGFRNRRGSN